MKYREAAAYTNRSTIEIKTEFEDILEALEEIGNKQEISIALLDFWLHGSILPNYHIYLQKLNAEQLLANNGVPRQHIKSILQDDALDRYLLFKNACLNFIGEELTDDFKTAILEPIDKLYTQPYDQDKQHRAKELAKVRNIIKDLKPNIEKSITGIKEVEPYIIAGTFEENIFIKLQQIEHLIVNQVEA